jgi:sigma-E factor negative regulatory protein RseB
MRPAKFGSGYLGVLALALAVALCGAASAAEPVRPAAPAHSGQPSRPMQWLRRMNHALTALDYEGTFAHSQDGKVQMLRIIHRVKDGVVSERLQSLDGSGREFIRRGSKLTCYLPDKRVVLVEHMLPRSSLLGDIPVINAQTARFYDIREVARMRIDQHATRLITVMPKDQYRYGYRLWIDRSGLPLKIQLWDTRNRPGGHVIEQIAFATLEVRSHIPGSAFKPGISTAGYRWLRTDASVPRSVRMPAWSAEWLPPGFHMAMSAAQVMPGSPGPVDHLVYTDGLASVSVFVERHTETASRGPVVESARMGASYVFSTFVDGHRVTAVGEVPARTVRSIADSVRAAGKTSLPRLPAGPFAHSPEP